MLEFINPDFFDGFARRRGICLPTILGLAEDGAEVVGAGVAEGLQLREAPVAPRRGDLVRGRLAAAGQAAADNCPWHGRVLVPNFTRTREASYAGEGRPHLYDS